LPSRIDVSLLSSPLRSLDTKKIAPPRRRRDPAR
jgi:hypothetical protein